jgi:sterol desaturase/sphingolipid hydroxylase (fatty acid hydroxylase superfamily)
VQQFLEGHQSTILISTLIGALLIGVIWEVLAPRRPETRGLAYRWANNITLAVLNHVVVYWVGAALAVATAWWAETEGLGLLQHFDIGVAGAFVVTLLAMELLAYVLHRVVHRVPIIWRLHAMHHSDVEVDFTTTYRHHPFENMLVMAIGAPFVMLLGAPVAAMVLYQVLRVSVNVLSHSNIRVPETVERWLKYLLVTPDFHHLHHCSDRRFTDSNYSATVPWFDYLFGTATQKPYAAYATMELGLERFRDPVDSRVDQVLLMPFNGRRYKTAPAAELHPTADNPAT